MKQSSHITKVGAIAGAIITLSMPAFGAVVYDNSNSLNYQGRTSITSDKTVGDEITLAGTARTVTTFDFSYFLSAAPSGNETAVVKFFANDGASGKPGTLLYFSPSFGLEPSPTGINSINISDLTVSVPDTFTWAVTFSGLSGGEEAGLVHYFGPSVGSSAADHWEGTDDANLGLFNTGSGFSDNFAAKVQAVPEPTTLALLSVGAAGLFMAARRRKA